MLRPSRGVVCPQKSGVIAVIDSMGTTKTAEVFPKRKFGTRTLNVNDEPQNRGSNPTKSMPWQKTRYGKSLEIARLFRCSVAGM